MWSCGWAFIMPHVGQCACEQTQLSYIHSIILIWHEEVHFYFYYIQRDVFFSKWMALALDVLCMHIWNRPTAIQWLLLYLGNGIKIYVWKRTDSIQHFHSHSHNKSYISTHMWIWTTDTKWNASTENMFQTFDQCIIAWNSNEFWLKAIVQFIKSTLIKINTL